MQNKKCPQTFLFTTKVHEQHMHAKSQLFLKHSEIVMPSLLKVTINFEFI